MWKPEIKGAFLRGAVLLELYRVIGDNAPYTRATGSHMQLKAMKRADAKLEHPVRLYAQEAQHALVEQRTYYNLLTHCQ